MKAIKIGTAILLAIVLLIAESMVMGMFSLDRAMSESTINNALEETGLVDELVEEAISESTVSMGGEYGEVIQKAVNTDAMRDFFAAYMTSAVRGEAYGGDYEEIGEDDLMTAFSSAVEELNASGDIDISSSEKSIIMNQIEKEIPDLADELNSIASQYDTTDSEALDEVTTDSGTLQSLMSLGTRLIAVLVCAGIFAGLIALFWRSKAGFLWCAVVTAIVSLVYLALTALGGNAEMLSLSYSAADRFVFTLLAGGFKSTAIGGFIVTGILIALYIIFKIRDRRRRSAGNAGVSSTQI